MIAEVADALDYAHQQGVIHRDIKPSNLLLSPAGRLSVNDFGLARILEQPGMTMTGEFVGTPAYMSPEQITAGRTPLDHRTDIYSLGATLYELLTLYPPFTGERRDQMLAQILHKEPKLPRRINAKIPLDLETICLKCLEKDPDRRYQTAGALAEDLRRYVNRFAISARRAGPITKLKKWAKRNPALAAACLIAVLAMLTSGLLAYRSYQAELQRSADERKREEQIVAEKRQAAMDKAILAAMSSQFDEADAALLEAERLGADLAQRRFVAGIVKHYRGESDEAKRLLLEACGERPDWLAPHAFLAVVCNNLHDFLAEVEHGNTALRLAATTAEDFLFRGLVVGTSNPRRALPDLEEAWQRRRSVLAQFVRAQVLNALADDTGRIEDSIAARDAFQGARPFLGNAPLAIATGLYIQCMGCNNCRIHGRNEDAARWLAEGLADFHAAGRGACRKHPLALAARSAYLYLRDGSPESLDAENREMGRRGPQSEACRVYLASLLRRGKTDEALEYLHGFPDNLYHLTEYRAAFLMSRDLEAARAELRRAVAGTAQRGWRGYLIYGLNLVGLPDEAPPLLQDFQSLSTAMAEWLELVPFINRVLAHVYQGRRLDVEAEIAGSRWKRQLAYDTLGFAALGRGEREKARAWFRKANEHPPLNFSSYLWLRAIRERVLADEPIWPPWLAKKM